MFICWFNLRQLFSVNNWTYIHHSCGMASNPEFLFFSCESLIPLKAQMLDRKSEKSNISQQPLIFDFTKDPHYLDCKCL